LSFRTSVILYLPVGRVWLGFLKFSVFLNGLFKFFSAHKLYYTFPHLIHTQCQRFLGSSYITNTHQNNPDLQQLRISHHHFSIINFCNLTVRQNIFDQTRSTGFGLKKNNDQTRPNPAYGWT